MTLTEFLLARIAEDEARIGRLRELVAEDTGELPYSPSPDRALAECEAKRRIVEHCRYDDWTRPGWKSIGEPGEGELAEVLCFLALPYADHDDYDEEWKP